MRRERLISKVLRRSKIDMKKGLSKSIDVIGDIAILKLPEKDLNTNLILAETLLNEINSIKVVFRQIGPISGDYRLRDIEWLAGENRSCTIYKEHGCQIEVDLKRDYFSPRLSYERTRIAKQVRDDEVNEGAKVIINMFAGVGSFSIRIAKETESSKTYSIDFNPDAVQRMFRNVILNKLLARITCVYGDATNIVNNVLKGTADRILMPLPEKSTSYLKSAVSGLKNKGGIINFQNFVYASNNSIPVNISRLSVCSSLNRLKRDYEIESERVIRSVGPGWYQVAHDIRIGELE